MVILFRMRPPSLSPRPTWARRNDMCRAGRVYDALQARATAINYYRIKGYRGDGGGVGGDVGGSVG